MSPDHGDDKNYLRPWFFGVLFIAAAGLLYAILRSGSVLPPPKSPVAPPPPNSPITSRPGPLAGSPGSAEFASALIDRVRKESMRRMPFDFMSMSQSETKSIVESELAAVHAGVQDLLKGCNELLQQGSVEEKKKAARFLARLGNPSAITPLIAALSDPEWSVREAACYALQWLDAEGDAVESNLVGLCREDPAIDVRVAAAVALGDSHHDEAVAAFKLGLKSTSLTSVNSWFWMRCEDHLEKKGKLELPLPEQVYTEISQEQYREIKARNGVGWYRIKRETRQKDTIYLEEEESDEHAPTLRRWYRTKVSQ
jgi:hypothetical protein